MNQKKKSFSKPKSKKDYMVDASHQQDFIFNRTPILASALRRLKNDNGKSNAKIHKRENEKPEFLSSEKPKKKVKRSQEDQQLPSALTYSALNRDLYNFFTVNKPQIKSIEQIPQPKFEVGSLVLTAICDRGIGGKYLATNFFRNKKGYIDFKEISQLKDPQAIEAYRYPGDYVIATVTRGNNPKSIQLSLSEFIAIDQKTLRIGQCLPAEVKSKEEMGCHLMVKNCKKYRFYLAKQDVSEETYETIEEKKQLICFIKEINDSTHLVKVQLSERDPIFLTMKGIQQEEMGKLQLEQYVVPGTLINTKILKIAKNGIIVKFLKVFLGFIHMDHLERPLESYHTDEKIHARVIYYCVNPPTIYLSERHVSIPTYEPQRELYQAVRKPTDLIESQGSFFNFKEEMYIHPLQLHSQIQNINKFWVKENNFFQRYQILCSKKLGLRVGEVAKNIPFTNFKVFGEKKGEKGQIPNQSTGKFRVMCLDVWNKVVKISHDKKILKAENLLLDLEDLDPNKKYCGFIFGVNSNGVIIEFCNNIRGIISKNELKANEIDISEGNIGEGFEAYISNIKKGLSSLSLVPPELRRKKQQKSKGNSKGPSDEIDNIEQTSVGTIQSIDPKSINPIYVKLKSKIVKISIFGRILPASLETIEILRNLQEHYQIGQKVHVFKKGKEFYLYPPEQLSDKGLKICRSIKIQGNNLRLQTGREQFRNCHISDISDLIIPYPFSEIQIGQYYIGRQLENSSDPIKNTTNNSKNVCLRDSIVQNGLPKTMKQYKEKFSANEYRGDFRNRLIAAGSPGLNIDNVIFGYIKAYTEKGCFVSLSKDYEVRMEKCELSDDHIQDKAKHFKSNQLILLRLISEKVRQNQPNKKLFDASSRESVIKYGYPLNADVLMSGLTVSGVVSGYTKGRALVKLDASRETGIINPIDLQDADPEMPLEKILPIGSHLTCKITDYQTGQESGKKLIRLSTLKKHFLKFKGVQLQEFLNEKDQRIWNIWDSFKEMAAEAEPQTGFQKEIELQEEEKRQNSDGDQDEYERLNRLLGTKGKKADKMVEEQEESEGQQEQNSAMDVQEQGQGQDSENAEEDEEMGENDNASEQASEESESKEKQPPTNPNLKSILSQFQTLPHPPSFYHSLLLANTTPESHLLYISSLLPTSSPQEIRTLFKRAIASLPQIKEKDTMWISWLNTQVILGGFMETVKMALQNGVGMDVHFRISQILMEQENWTVGLEFAKKMLKKFNRQPKAYAQFIKIVLLYGNENKIPERFTPEEIIKRAKQCLKSPEVVTLESHYGKTLYEFKENEKARNVFQNLITKYPNRTDLWSIYTDLQLKHGQEIDRARNLMERALSIGLKKKKIITILKKYHQMEVNFGDQEAAERILDRAKEIAKGFEKKQQKSEQGDDDEDISD